MADPEVRRIRDVATLVWRSFAVVRTLSVWSNSWYGCGGGVSEGVKEYFFITAGQYAESNIVELKNLTILPTATPQERAALQVVRLLIP